MLHNRAHAALLAYEPFTNPPGASIIGSAGGLGFSGAWQANSSGGVATNTGYALAYTDSSSNVLITTGGAGFFQGLTSANTSMQPTRMLTQARGTNGTDGVTTWISFLAVRQGPSVAGANPFPRGANIAHDINANALQKLAAGNSSGASSNTVGLIPQGNSANLKSSAISFSSTNLIIVRIDHLAGSANDNAYLFVNPSLATEPAVGQANASSLGSFDFSFDRIRVFAGGNASASQPYAELVIDEYRVGETYADVTPHTSPQSPVTDIVITNIASSAGKIVISGAGGPGGGTFLLLATGDLAAPVSTWPVTSTNHFDSGGLFNVTSSVAPPPTFYRLQVAPAPPANPPVINAGPTNVTVLPGQSALFGIDFTGDAPLSFQWFFNTNAPIANGTNATLNLAGVQATNAGSYSVRVTNSAGSATSGFAILTVLAPPAITSQPSGLSVAAGSSASFSVTALGSGTLSYQWYFNTNTTLNNATSQTLTLTNVQSTNAGAYLVIVTNDYGATTSAVAQLTVSSGVDTNGAFFVSPSGSDSDPGTIDRPFKTISKGLTAVGTGGVVYLRNGTYLLPSKLSLSKIASPTNMIRIWAYPMETPVIDSTGNTSDGISISGTCYYLKGLEQKLSGHNGILFSGFSNILENCVVHENGNTGIHITGGQSGSVYPAYNLILNCDSYLNFDSPIGGNADGFSAKWQIGPGNVFRGCRSYNNSDDGWDLWMGTSTVVIENCWSFRNGVDSWHTGQVSGNGNGFKVGGNNIGTPHIVRNCVSFDNAGNTGRGYDENNNLSGQTIYNCTAYRNQGDNYHFANTVTNGQHLIRNCISFLGTVTITSGTIESNSWQGFTVSAADFQSLDTTLANAPRDSNGALPSIPLFRLAPGSSMINAGTTNTGLPYNGTAPDLGAFETGP